MGKYKTRVHAMEALGDGVSDAIKGPLVARILGNELVEKQVEWIVSLQSLRLTGVPLLSLIGAGKIVLIIVCLVRWLDGSEFGWAPPFAASIMLCITGFSKQSLKGPRPYWMNEKVKTLDPTLETSYGFPSGHTTCMFSIYGLLCWHYVPLMPDIFKVIVPLLWLIISCAVGFSRIYTGAHFVHDVVGGAILGISISVVTIAYEYWTAHIETEAHQKENIWVMFLISLLILFRVIVGKSRVKLIMVYEAVAGSGFLFGLACAHAADNYFKIPHQTLSPLHIAIGLLYIVVIDRLMKMIPTDSNETQSILGICLTTFGYSVILFLAVWLWPVCCQYLTI